MPDVLRVFILGDDQHTIQVLGRIFEKGAGFQIEGSSLVGTVPFDPGLASVVIVQTRHPESLAALAHWHLPRLALVPKATVSITAADGVLPLDSDATQMRAAALAVAAGLRVQAPAGNTHQEDEIAFLDPLTERELSVLNLMAEGFSNPEIATHLGISRNTAKFHVSSIMSKLGVASRTEAVTVGLKRGLIIV